MMKEYTMQVEELKIPIQIIRSGRSTIALEIKKDLSVRARIPYKLSDEELEKFLLKHRAWLIKKYRQIATSGEKDSPVIPIQELTKQQITDMKHAFTEKVAYYANLMDVTYGRICIKNQRTRWGSCSSKGNLNFNYQLYFLPEELMDYVIVHELAHRKYMNHSKEFWQQVERYYPEYKRCEKQLKNIGIR